MLEISSVDLPHRQEKSVAAQPMSEAAVLRQPTAQVGSCSTRLGRLPESDVLEPVGVAALWVADERRPEGMREAMLEGRSVGISLGSAVGISSAMLEGRSSREMPSGRAVGIWAEARATKAAMDREKAERILKVGCVVWCYLRGSKLGRSDSEVPEVQTGDALVGWWIEKDS
jgi:hypothetical protein